MPIYGFGPRARRVYDTLHERIVRGEWPAGQQLPPHLELAEEFGVAPMTMRQVLSQLEEEGLVSRQVGRGTFVQQIVPATVLVVDTDAATRLLHGDLVARAGFRAVAADSAGAGLTLARREPATRLVLAGLRLPGVAEGVGFVRAMRRRWPNLPLAVAIADVGDLAALYGDPAWPLLILPKPVRLAQVEEVLRLAATAGPNGARPLTLDERGSLDS